MDAQIQAALWGAIAGAIAVGGVTHFQKISERRQAAVRAFELFLALHTQWSKICGANQKIQQRDYPLLLQSLTEILPSILKDSHGSTQKFIFEYSVTIRELAGYVAAGNFGLTNGPESKLDEIVGSMKSLLQDQGILSLD